MLHDLKRRSETEPGGDEGGVSFERCVIAENKFEGLSQTKYCDNILICVKLMICDFLTNKNKNK